MFDQKVYQVISALASDSCRELFAGYGVELVEVEPSASDGMLLCGVIGFTSEHLRGTCILVMTKEPLHRSNPIQGRERDWLAELTNQLVGRLKNKLLLRGVEVYVTLPVVLHGDRIAPLSKHPTSPTSFSCGDGLVYLWVEIDSTLEDLPEEAPSEGIFFEGDALMF